MHMGMQAQFNLVCVEFELICGFHVSDHIVEDFDLIDSYLYAIWKLLRWLISLFEPRIRRDLFQAVAKLRVRHQNILYEVLNFLAQETGELVASVEDLLV